MSKSPFDLSKLLEAAGTAASQQALAMRSQLLGHINKAVASDFGLKDGYKACQYPDADYGRGRLLFKPGQKLVLHVRGTVMGRSEDWQDGTIVDFSFHFGKDVALVVSERDDTPADRRRFLVHFNGFVEHLG
jgi:hypothetical protein